MPVDLNYLRRVIDPCPGFLLTREQMERMQSVVRELISEVEIYRAAEKVEQPRNEEMHGNSR